MPFLPLDPSEPETTRQSAAASTSSQLRPHARSRGVRSSSKLVTAGLALAALSCGGSSPPPALAPPTAPTTAPSGATAPSAQATTRAAADKDDSWPGRDTFSLSDHVPNNAIAFFQVRSLRELEEAMLRIQTVTGSSAEEADVTLATEPMTRAGIDPSRIDRGSKIGLAYAVAPGQFFPTPVIIAPALDDESIDPMTSRSADRGMQARRVDAGYVVVEHASMHETVPRGDSPLTRSLPEGLVQGRFASDAFAPLLSSPLGALAEKLNESYRLSRPRTSASELYEFDAGEAVRLIGSMDVVALGLSVEGDRADLRVHVTRKDGVMPEQGEISQVSTTVRGLSRYIDTSDPLSMLFASNGFLSLQEIEGSWQEARETSGLAASDDLATLLELHDGTRDLVTDSLSDLRQGFHPGAAISFCLEPAKAHAAVYLSAKDDLRAREWISLLLSRCELDTVGFEMALPIRSRVDEIMVEDYTVRFDSERFDFDQRAEMRSAFKAFLGDSTLHVKVATKGHDVLVVLGGDTAAVSTRIREFNLMNDPAEHLHRALAALDGADSATILHTDFIKLLGQVAGIVAVSSGRSVAETAREIAREVGDAEAPFTFWSGDVASESIFGTTFDLSALSKTFDAFKGSGL